MAREEQSKPGHPTTCGEEREKHIRTIEKTKKTEKREMKLYSGIIT